MGIALFTRTGSSLLWLVSAHIPFDMPRLSADEMEARSREIYNRLRTRRSVRDFSPEDVSLEVIKNCLKAAGTAPNGANLQPWRFVVVSDPEIKRRIRAAAEKEEEAFYSGRATEAWLDALAPLGTDAKKPFIEDAPHLIAIFGVKSRVQPDGSMAKNYYVTESVGIATGMLITALHECGLATLTHTPSPMAFLNQILERPNHERPFLLLIVGRPAAEATVPRIAKKPLKQIAIFK